MKKLFTTLILILFSISLSFCIDMKDKKIFRVKDFGAKSDGVTLNTQNIQAAIDKAAKKGGVIHFDKGIYLTGSLEMKSNVDLLIEEGTILLGSTDPRHYHNIEPENAPKSPKTDDNSKLALLLAYNVSSFKITGGGTIDGQGRELALTIDSLHHTGELIDPHYAYGRPRETVRPKIINFMDCKDVEVSDLLVKNSSCWVMTYEICENLLLEGLTIKSRAFWNNDGIDVSDSKNVIIRNCDVNTADDGICLKSYYPGYYNDNILIEDCVIRTSASAIKFGTASVGGFKNVKINNIKVFDTFRSAIALEAVDGGFIENIEISNIEAKNTGNAFFVRLGNRGGDAVGYVKNITFKNVKAEIPFGRPDIDYDMRGPALGYFHNQFPAPITGIPGYNIENIHFENIELIYPGRASKGQAYAPLWRLDAVNNNEKGYPEYSMFGELPSWGFYIRHVDGLTMKNVKVTLTEDDFRPAIVLDYVKDVKIEGLDMTEQNHKQIILKDAENIEIEGGREKCLEMK